jgi:C_GCAxxG_C_C family probable redox protein
MGEIAQQAEAMFRGGFNCAQSVLACCGDGRGVSRDAAIRLAGGFGGGIGRMGEACGAVTGAIMALGLVFASPDPLDAAAKQRIQAKTDEFIRRFRERHGAVDCRDLIGCDISAPEAMKKAREAGIFKTVCPPLVRSAAQIVEEMIASQTGGSK